MSVVVPAYNESRLVGMLEEAVNYLENEYGTIADSTLPTSAEGDESTLHRRPNGHTNGRTNGKANGGLFPPRLKRGWEILLIDDGSKDTTLETAFGISREI
jgi:dolichyl-phosphate beta-glucosyltransferase